MLLWFNDKTLTKAEHDYSIALLTQGSKHLHSFEENKSGLSAVFYTLWVIFSSSLVSIVEINTITKSSLGENDLFLVNTPSLKAVRAELKQGPGGRN